MDSKFSLILADFVARPISSVIKLTSGLELKSSSANIKEVSMELCEMINKVRFDEIDCPSHKINLKLV